MDEAREEFPGLRVEEVNVAEHPEAAVKYGVMATPAIAINGRLEFSGVPREDALRTRLRAAASGAERR